MSEPMSVQNGTSRGRTAADGHHVYGLPIPHVLHGVQANGLAAQTEKKGTENALGILQTAKVLSAV